MDAMPVRRPGDYDPSDTSPRRGGDLAAAGQEARRRPGEWVFAGYGKFKDPWALAAWVRDVRQGKKAVLGGAPDQWDAEHVLGVMVDNEFLPDDPDEVAVGGERVAAKFIAYIGEVTS